MNERFKTLVRHFFSRFFDTESMSADADERANVVQIVALLAVPGALISLFTIANHALIRSEVTRQWLRAGDHYVFVSYAMVVMGFVMTFKWDSLFPDRRDYLILTPLPVSVRGFFVAKVIALCAFLLVFVVAINIFSCIIVPYGYLLRLNRIEVVLPAFIAHASAVLGGAIFMAMFFAALQGVLINLMSPAAFRRVSPWIQMISMAILVTVLLITPGISANLRLLVESNTPALDYIPMFWFLGIYEVINPESTFIPAAYDWAKTAAAAMLVVYVLFVVTYLVGYRRYSKKILEGVESEVFAQSWYARAGASMMNLTLLRHPVQRASFYFIGRIFGRSTKHRLFIAMYSGVGLAVMISSLFALRRGGDSLLMISYTGLTEAPLILSFFVVSGLRATFNIPYELNANWMFQVTSGTDAGEFLKAARTWVLARGIIPAYAALAPLEWMFLGAYEAMFNLLFGLAVAAVLTEVFFYRFNKVPFTCSYLPAKSHLAFLGAAYLYGFTIYTSSMSGLQLWVGGSPERLVLFFAVIGVILATLAWYRRAQLHSIQLIYEDKADPLVRTLNLSP